MVPVRKMSRVYATCTERPSHGAFKTGFYCFGCISLSGNKNALCMAKNAKFDLFLMQGRCRLVENGKIYEKSDS